MVGKLVQDYEGLVLDRLRLVNHMRDVSVEERDIARFVLDVELEPV